MDDILHNIGKRIKKIRKDKELTIKDIADRLNLTRSLISQIENNKVTPSIKTLAQIASILNTPITAFFEDIDDPNPVVRKSERQKLETRDGVSYELLTRNVSCHKFEVLKSTFEEDGTSGFHHKHSGEECGIVVKGKFRVETGDDEYTLGEGDSIYIDSSKPHRITNISDGESVALWINFPPSR